MSKLIPHFHPCRVYIEDTDAGGVVYHSNYLKYCERARTEMFRTFGFTNAGLIRDHNHKFVVVEATMKFFQGAQLDEELQVRTLLSEMTGASITLEQTVLRNTSTICQVYVKLALVNHNFRAIRLPKMIIDVLRKG